MNINGIKTINHETIPIPRSHKMFNNIVITAATTSFINAVLYKPLKVSIIICITEKIKYINAGEHNCICLYYINRK